MGLSEQIVGRWLAARSREVTDRIVLATKGRHSPDPDINAEGSSRRALDRALEQSLGLGRDEVDLYQLHAWDPLTPIEETLAFLDGAVRAGKVRYIGLSNFTGWQLQLTVSTARQMGVALPLTLQQQYSLLSRESEYEIVPTAEHNEIGLLPWSPLAGGFLTGKYQRGTTTAAANSRAGSDKPLYQWVSHDYADSERTWDTIEPLVQIADKLEVTPAQVALAWVADQPGVVGARTSSQLGGNLGAAELHRDALDAVSAPRPATYLTAPSEPGSAPATWTAAGPSITSPVGEATPPRVTPAPTRPEQRLTEENACPRRNTRWRNSPPSSSSSTPTCSSATFGNAPGCPSGTAA